MGKDSIFVSIAAFCDPFLRFTIESLFAEASAPGEITLGVVDQNFDSLKDWINHQPFADQVRYLHIDPLHSRGVCWARHLAQTLYDDESYYLQIDSHTWCRPNWDIDLRTSLEELSVMYHKPVITIYPPAFEFDQDGSPQVRGVSRIQDVSYFNPARGQVLSHENPVLVFAVNYHRLTDEQKADETTIYYARGFHVAGGFIFARGSFVREVPYDPLFYFMGEEQGVALRAFTRGWELFHPQYHRVPLQHLYKSSHIEPYTTLLHWRSDLERRRTVKWNTRRLRARTRLGDLLMDRLDPPYTLGNVRTLTEYTDLSGIDHLNLQIQKPEIELVKVSRPSSPDGAK